MLPDHTEIGFFPPLNRPVIPPYLIEIIIAEGIALVGDSAHVVHPMMGQGLNLGLMDAAVLVDELCKARDEGLALNHQQSLQRYQRARQRQVYSIDLATKALHRLYQHPHPMLRLVRNVGLSMTNRLPVIKTWLAAQANADDVLPKRFLEKAETLPF